MLLITTILPRRDGVVIAKSPDGARSFTFKKGDDGQLVCDVDDDATVAALLRTEHFYPADDADFDAALKLAGPIASAGTGDGSGDDQGPEEEDDDGDDDGDPDAPPVEGVPQAAERAPRAPRTPRAPRQPS